MEFLLTLFALLSFVSALFLLGMLAIIDFKTMLLPNKYVFPFAILGILFHLSMEFSVLDP
jgi:prepilin signal peptidase PulO-like enzyme (type II secretory pathway)